MWLLCAGFLHIGGICNIICEAIHFSPAVCHPTNVYSKKLPAVQTHYILGEGGRSNKYGLSLPQVPSPSDSFTHSLPSDTILKCFYQH